ncbi:MAG TPA: type II toxin-antitoxin system VapC family toxin [Frankiaceae bacterium]|nr:type II toxin-antitoxin system VapC family toxin [Frankiaceae bacterium]
MIAYFDTSALVKLLFDDEPGRVVAFAAWVRSERVVASTLLYPEATAALARARRGHRLTSLTARAAFRLLEHLIEEVELVDPTRVLLWEAASMARGHRLRGYDAVHLASALVMCP